MCRLRGMLFPNPDEFIYRDCQVGGDDCWLIFPSHLGVTWTPENLIFRSVIRRKVDNLVVSAGLPKFLNLNEKPHLYPDPAQFSDWRVTTKEDGSCVIVSKHNLEPIIRTRGTVSVDQHITGPEIRALVAQHRILEDPLFSRGEFSAIFEHNTPNCPIVIRHAKPELVLLKIIRHEDYSYMSPEFTDRYAKDWGVRRPDTHPFTRLDEIVKTCETLSGMEGFVLEYNGGRNMVKIKGLEYLRLHAFRSRVTLPNLLDLFFAYGKPELLGFLARIEGEFDFECAESARQLVTRIDEAYAVVKFDMGMMEGQLAPLRALSRRDAAISIQANYTDLWRGVAFKLLDRRDVDDKMLRKLIEAQLETPCTLYPTSLPGLAT